MFFQSSRVEQDGPAARLDPYACLHSLRTYFARRVAANDVDDMVQEVALRLQACGSRAEVDNGRAYLFQVARSVMIDRARRDACRQRHQHERLTEAHHPIEELSPARVLEAKEQLAQVLHALDHLPERTRQVFLLHRFDRVSHSGIADIVGVSVSSVEKHVMKATKFLLAELATD